jgi:hypothetical protein
MMIYWQSIVPQHVSGVFTHIIRREDCLWCSVLAVVVVVPESLVAKMLLEHKIYGN